MKTLTAVALALLCVLCACTVLPDEAGNPVWVLGVEPPFEGESGKGWLARNAMETGLAMLAGLWGGHRWLRSRRGRVAPVLSGTRSVIQDVPRGTPSEVYSFPNGVLEVPAEVKEA